MHHHPHHHPQHHPQHPKRAIVFIDGANLYYGMKSAGIQIAGLNFPRLAQKLAIGRRLVETRFYIGELNPKISGERQCQKQREFFAALRAQGVVLRLGRVERDNRGRRVEKAVDVMIAVDMVAMAYENMCDVVYLLSADGDFTPAVEKVRETGRKVYVASVTSGHKIAKAADNFIPLKRSKFRGCRD